MFSRTLLSIVVIIITLNVMTSCTKKTTEPADQCVTPVLSPTGGTYTDAQTVSITCATIGATIVYTIDGSDPTSGSLVYTSSIVISATTTVKAKAFKNGWTDSHISSATYTIETAQDRFVYVPGGTFTMGNTLGGGNSDELPTHQVTLSAFYIGKYEVTQSEWLATMGYNPATGYGVGDDYPVYNVSWYSIIKYSNLRSLAEGFTPVYTISGTTNPDNWGAVPTSSNAVWDAAICSWAANGYRLPTEAEWEYAARGGATTPDYQYSGSNDIEAVAWYDENNTPYGTKPGGGKAANGLGIYDMSGNIWEWCWDWDGSYSSAAQNNPTGQGNGSYRLLRGGYWDDGAGSCRVSNRSVSYPYGSNVNPGFRLCRAN